MAKKLFESDNADSLQRSLELFTRSARSFPDSWLAEQTHNYRAKIFEKLGEHSKAGQEKIRIKECYVLPDF